MVSSMDHKRANDHDTGLNTAAWAPLLPTPNNATPRRWLRSAWKKIFLPTIRFHERRRAALFRRGPFVLSVLALTTGRPKVIEYNCCLATETQVVLLLLKATCCTSCGLH